MYYAVYPHVAPYLTDWQHGLTRGRSCATQLASLTTLNEGKQMDVVFLDLQRHLAEWHIIYCCKKLGNFGISGALLNWCKDYLTDREQRVVIEGMISTWRPFPSDVPQGSLLGPFFFVIFISDLLELVMPGNCVSLYADDCKTSRIINCPVAHSVFQSNLDNFNAYN